jgi:hypothetical protein
MNLWLDDMRKPPWGFDLWAKTYEECIELLTLHKDAIVCVSLDHDLAPEHYVADSTGYMSSARREPDESVNKTGFRVLEWMRDNSWWPEELAIHTLSEFGRERMRRFCHDHARCPCVVIPAVG